MDCSLVTWLLCCCLSLDFRLIAHLTSSSFLSTKEIKSLMLVNRIGRLKLRSGSMLPTSSWLLYLLYWQNILMKNTMRANKHARPQMRKRPQKLPRLNRFESISLSCELQPVRASHLSWILWRSPFSDSVRMAVDRSTARGESLGKACQSKMSIFRTTIGFSCWDHVMQVQRMLILTKPHPLFVNS